MSDEGKREIAKASADWFVMKMPPWVSEARRAMWHEMIQDAIYCAILTYDGLREDGPKLLRTFCIACARPLQAKAKMAGRTVRCQACGRQQRLRFGRN